MPLPLVRLPPLDLVRGFVAVGRRMSITLAADDLCVTQSAMSKQVRALEDLLGVKLLHRGYRSVRLTEEGERLFRSADAAVQQLQDAFAGGGRRPVTITASIGTAALWLLPRLGEFQRRHPEVDVRVAASNSVLNLASEQIDLAIRYCAEAQAPRGAVRLFDETIAPVASAALGLRTLDTERALGRQVLLEYEDRRPWLRWADWLAARGLTAQQARGILRFNQYDQVIQAAIAGQGVALGRMELLAPMLEDGRLQVIRAAGGAAASASSYWLLQAEAAPRRDVAKVADWIRAEAGQRPPSAGS
ncbi:MAG: LysR family transcriptional regulator [Comamonadaceae bacterium]|nr:MAG: LysR family transcriptional regulator [Comamonadaceae bacterium]